MVIQCPACKSRYRTNNFSPGQSAARVKCPKCSEIFFFSPEDNSTESSTKQPVSAILIVDDARFFREILTELLAPLQLELITVATAGDALKMLEKRDFHLVLVDLNLPDMNGLELMRKIRSIDSRKQPKLLAMSGAYRKEDCETDAIRAGADGFLNKSFKPEELQQRIKAMLDQ